MADKVVTAVMKVDLQCPRCYRKIKKVLCKFPEVRSQMYDEKQNKVMFTVVTCCPDVILKRIASKGGRSVEGIEILPEKKKEPEKKDAGGDKDKPKDAAGGEKKKDAGGDKPKDAAGGEKKKDAGGDKPKDAAGGEKKKDAGGDKPKQAPAEKKPEAQVHKDVFGPTSGFPTIYPSGMFYNNQPYYPGHGGMVPMPMPTYPSYGGGMVPMPMPTYPSYGVPAYEGYVGNWGGGYSNTGRFDYFSEENPEACSIM
ncbi:hypothetical protein MLD38_027730 [Melastoma candidum]|uniref:Uncharacterized protein n=1 Tax=Melastoma candidum TaxID=119954 RepID=A0ACB9P2I1_9MYRT|nr:hypothetical protein MLD38_027730 [Melastoma candidum]